MSEQQQEVAPTKDEESKPMNNGIATNIDKPDKGPATRQIKERPRYPTREPGLFPVPVDIVITMSIQLTLTITNFFVIISSFAYSGDDLGWYILFEVIFTYIGFSYFVKKISDQILVYKKFFRDLNNWRDRRLQKIENNESDCPLFWWILVRVTWWVCALLLFPIIIFWSMYQSYKWYQDRRKQARSYSENCEITIPKMSDRAYSVWHLGVLSKQASMITLFIQDLPLLIISIMIKNYLGIIVYSISISIKLLCWIKHMIDLGKLTLFYDCIDYLDHFGIREIEWEYEEIFEINSIVRIKPEFYNELEYEMSTLQRGDWIKVYDEDKTNYKIMVIYKNKHFRKTENIIAVDLMAAAVSVQSFDDYFSGKTKKIDPEIPDNCFHTLNRWSGNIRLLRDEEFKKYHDIKQDDEEEEEEEEEKEEREQDQTQPTNYDQHRIAQTNQEEKEEEEEEKEKEEEQIGDDADVAGSINNGTEMTNVNNVNNVNGANGANGANGVDGDLNHVKIDMNDDDDDENVSLISNKDDNKATEADVGVESDANVNDDKNLDENEETEKQSLSHGLR